MRQFIIVFLGLLWRYQHLPLPSKMMVQSFKATVLSHVKPQGKIPWGAVEYRAGLPVQVAASQNIKLSYLIERNRRPRAVFGADIVEEGARSSPCRQARYH